MTKSIGRIEMLKVENRNKNEMTKIENRKLKPVGEQAKPPTENYTIYTKFHSLPGLDFF